jgi:phage terminase small subunit
MTQIVVTLPDEAPGPKMRALNERQRAFVYALVECGGNMTRAAAAAGYGQESDDRKKKEAAWQQAGSRLGSDPKVLAAIKEEAEKRVHSGALIAASELLKIAQDPTSKAQIKAITEILDRAGLISVKRVEVNHTVENRTDQEKIDRIVAMSERLGVDPRRLLGFDPKTGIPNGVDPSVVDAEFEVIHPAEEALSPATDAEPGSQAAEPDAPSSGSAADWSNEDW